MVLVMVIILCASSPGCRLTTKRRIQMVGCINSVCCGIFCHRTYFIAGNKICRSSRHILSQVRNSVSC